MVNYIKCINVNYVSETTENYYDISLNVKDMGNIYEAFKQFVEVLNYIKHFKLILRKKY